MCFVEMFYCQQDSFEMVDLWAVERDITQCIINVVIIYEVLGFLETALSQGLVILIIMIIVMMIRSVGIRVSDGSEFGND